MRERSQEELRAAVYSKFGTMKGFDRLPYTILGNPETGVFSLRGEFPFHGFLDVALLEEIENRKVIAIRQRNWSDESQEQAVRPATISYQDDLVACQYLVSPQTEVIAVTLTQANLGEHSTRHAIV